MSNPVADTSAVSGRFQHTPLDLKRREIRLVRIQPCSDVASATRVEIKHVDFGRHVDAVSRSESNKASRTASQTEFGVNQEAPNHKSLDDDKLEYIALSYTWGAEVPTHDILVDSQDHHGWFTIRQNLYDFLKVRQDTFDVTPWFWIDQLCIDQKNDVEKGHQVNLMGAIYRTATNVKVWFSPAFEGSDELMDVILYGDEIDILKKRKTFRVSMGKNRLPIPYASFLRLWNMPNWSRVWIIQELWVNETAIVRLGHKTLPWRDFCNGICCVIPKIITPNPAIHLKQYLDFRIELQRREMFIDREWRDLDWNLTFWLVDNTECSDSRDRAYGVMGLMPEALRFYPDYSLSAQQVLLNLIRVQARTPSARPALYSIPSLCFGCTWAWFSTLNSQNHPIDTKMARRFLLEEIFPTFEKDVGTVLTWLYKIRLWLLLPKQNGKHWRRGPSHCSHLVKYYTSSFFWYHQMDD